MSTLVTIEPEATLLTLQALAIEDSESSLPAEPITFRVPTLDSPVPAVLDPYNERIKLYDVTADALISALPEVPGSQLEPTATKVTAYALPGEEQSWRDLGFRREAIIRGFYPDGVDAHLWAAYADGDRGTSERELDHRLGVTIAQGKTNIEEPILPTTFQSRLARLEDAPEITDLLQQTFEDYPSPIEEEIIAQQIATHANTFRLVLDGDGNLAAAASAELDHRRGSAEMTDCATRPTYRGHGLMAYLLHTLEKDIAQEFQITDLYTIARADEIGMNCVFSKLGYDYSGRLVNNCRMPNGWESMNVWCKKSSINLDN